MAPTISAASSWSSLQSKVTMPRSRLSTRSEADVTFQGSNRYRVLDSNMKQQETEDVERAIRNIESQRKYRMTGSRSKNKLERQEAAVVPFESGKRLKAIQQRGPEVPVPQAFQDQVLEELRKLKESQRLEFEALERLQREKEMAERKACRLEKQLQKQQCQESFNQDMLESRELKTRRKTSFFEDFEQNDNGTLYPCKTSGTMDTHALQNELQDEDDIEVRDWDDVTKSPPPYFTVASPATSPYKRNAGWPAWTEDDSFLSGPSLGPPECSSPVMTKILTRHSQARDTKSSSQNYGTKALHARRLSRKCRSFSDGGTSKEMHEVRRSCAFFEEKARAHAEAEQLEKEAAQRLERARHAVPPQRLLERQALAQERKSQRLEDRERELMYRMQQVKARKVPGTTYMGASGEEAEQKRKERIRLRAEDMMRSAEVPLRMAQGGSNGGHMSIKLQNQLRRECEERAKRRRHRPKPVPDFDKLHFEWETALKNRKEACMLDKQFRTNGDFFTSREATLLALQDKKKARKLRLLAKQEAIKQHAKQAQDELLARTIASQGASQSRPTKTEILRAQKLLAEATRQERERERQEREAEVRERKQEQATRRVQAQVKRSESVRREKFAGTYVDVNDLEMIAKAKAREQRQQFKEAIARNKEKLCAATASCPSLMERFSTDVKRETHRRAALEAVVKSVFQKNLSSLKGVLTDDEHEVACAMVAADNDE